MTISYVLYIGTSRITYKSSIIILTLSDQKSDFTIIFSLNVNKLPIYDLHPVN